MEVEVAYALPERQTLLRITVPEGATVADAVRLSGILRRHPEIDLATNRVGVFGELTELDRALEPGDRVEVYRPLTADPKEHRRRRARGEGQG